MGCVAQMSGTVNKKGDVIEAKARTQIDIILPPDLKDGALLSLAKCKDVGMCKTRNHKIATGNLRQMNNFLEFFLSLPCRQGPQGSLR